MTASALGHLCDQDRFEPGSFRDPTARVLEQGGRIFRILSRAAADEFVWLRDHSIVEAMTRAGMVVPAVEVDPSVIGLNRSEVPLVLEHERVPWVSYPYEWTFSALKAAALLHLDLHLALLERGATLRDASAYNVQFRVVRVRCSLTCRRCDVIARMSSGPGIGSSASSFSTPCCCTPTGVSHSSTGIAAQWTAFPSKSSPHSCRGDVDAHGASSSTCPY
jgi:hypothetical protein